MKISSEDELASIMSVLLGGPNKPTVDDKLANIFSELHKAASCFQGGALYKEAAATNRFIERFAQFIEEEQPHLDPEELSEEDQLDPDESDFDMDQILDLKPEVREILQRLIEHDKVYLKDNPVLNDLYLAVFNWDEPNIDNVKFELFGNAAHDIEVRGQQEDNPYLILSRDVDFKDKFMDAE